MSFSTFKSKAPPRERKDRSDEFASFTPRSRKAERGSAELRAALIGIANLPVASIVKTPDRKRQAIRDSARDEECTVRIEGVCSGDPAHTIWSHAPLGAAGKGRGIKALDLCGAFACVECDAVVDGQRKRPDGMTREQVLLDWHNGHMRSLMRLAQKGLL